MPVIDHPVHESIKRFSGHKNGCWNQPRPKSGDDGGGYYAPDRVYLDDGSFVQTTRFIPHWDGMTISCQYDQAISPEYCDGCEHIRVPA